jgi:GGDEF domain-containing protein
MHGHYAGNEVLKKIAGIGKENIRTNDPIAGW